MDTTELNLLDGTFLNLDRRSDSWSVHLEFQVEGHFERERLEEAILTALHKHPIARSRLNDYADSSSKYFWQILETPEHLPLTRFKAANKAEVQKYRDQLVSLQVPVTMAPCFLLYWIEYRGGDYLMLNVPHTLADGLSCFRLMQSIIRAYGSQEDPVPDLNVRDVRNLAELAGSQGMTQRLERAKILVEHLGKSRTPPVRIQAGEESKADGYAFLPLELNATQTKQFMAKRVKPATVNDMLLAATALSVRRWNDEHGKQPGRIALMMPVNLRPQAWWHDVFGNYSSYVSVSVSQKEQTGLVPLSADICKQTTDFKEAGAAGTLIDLLDLPKFLPAIMKARLKELFPIFGKVLMETSWVSNLGKLDDNLEMGPAGRIKDLYFSPPAPMPCSVAVGITCFGSRLMLGFRFRKSQFNHAEMQEFVDIFKSILIE